MTWGALSSSGVGPQYFIKKKSTHFVYQDVVEHFMPPADKLYGDADFILEQDLAPAHTAKSTDTWFNDQRITVLEGQQTGLI